ncbi:MAG: oligoribonuclease [Polyangiaceae bacterium]|nr:oligoribonuclease [Polyangiaceae bacterium]
MEAQYDRLAWVDVETTGLNPDLDAILEVGIIITDRSLTEIDRASWALGDANPASISDPKVLEMHTRSGLLAECEASDLEIDILDEIVCFFLKHQGAVGSPMCGSTVGFDRSFLRHARFAKLFHYRNFDVSTYRTEARLLGIEPPPKREVHRALPDLEDSIALAKWAMARVRT